jgi:cysteine synthase
MANNTETARQEGTPESHDRALVDSHEVVSREEALAVARDVAKRNAELLRRLA